MTSLKNLGRVPQGAQCLVAEQLRVSILITGVEKKKNEEEEKERRQRAKCCGGRGH